MKWREKKTPLSGIFVREVIVLSSILLSLRKSRMNTGAHCEAMLVLYTYNYFDIINRMTIDKIVFSP